VLHDDDGLETDSTDEGIWLGCGRGDEGKDIEALLVAEKKVVWSKKCSAGWGCGEMGGREILSEC